MQLLYGSVYDISKRKKLFSHSLGSYLQQMFDENMQNWNILQFSDWESREQTLFVNKDRKNCEKV